MKNLQEAEQNALQLAMMVAPTSKEQQGFSKMFNEMKKDRLQSKEIVQQICGGILDGIYYGNWPV